MAGACVCVCVCVCVCMCVRVRALGQARHIMQTQSISKASEYTLV